jgi:hypothetical protein
MSEIFALTSILRLSKWDASERGPGFRRDVFDLPVGHVRQTSEHVTQIGVRVDATAPAAVDDRVDDGTALARVRLANEKPGNVTVKDGYIGTPKRHGHELHWNRLSTNASPCSAQSTRREVVGEARVEPLGGNYFDVPGNARCAVRLGLRGPCYSDSRDGFRICLGRRIEVK